MVEYDVAIVGGGVVGASLALALSASQLKVILMDAKPAEVNTHPHQDGRSLALSVSSQRILSALGVWPALQSLATPIKRIVISDQGHWGRAILNAAEEKVDALGYVTPITAVQSQLNQFLAASAVKRCQPALVKDVKVNQNAATLTVDAAGETQKIHARLVVIADGGNAALRTALGIEANTIEYDQTAIVGRLTPSLAHQNVAYERFTRQGPLALLPLTENRMAFIWTVAKTQAKDLLALPDGEFLQQLQRNFGDSVGALQGLSPRQAFPLRLMQVAQPVLSRIVLLGNAKHTLHPVAGQGFNLALRSVAVLAEALQAAAKQQEDVGSIEVLSRYAKQRKADEAHTIRFTHGLVQLFSNDLFPLTAVRSVGLALIDKLPPVKSWLVRRAMGLMTPTSRMAANIPPREW